MSVIVVSSPFRWTWDLSPAAVCLKTRGKSSVNMYTNKANNNRFFHLKEARMRKDNTFEWFRNDNLWPTATALAWKQPTLALCEHKSQSILSYGTLKYREQKTSQGECDVRCFVRSLSQRNTTEPHEGKKGAQCNAWEKNKNMTKGIRQKRKSNWK